jgi:chaperonin GroES
MFHMHLKPAHDEGSRLPEGHDRTSESFSTLMPVLSKNGRKWIKTEVREMPLNVTPLHDRILVTRLEAKEMERSGIIIPDTAKEKPQEGQVMAVGAGKIEKGKRIPLDVKVGDRILFGKYTGNDIKIDDQEYLILREEEVLARVGGIAKAASGKK